MAQVGVTKYDLLISCPSDVSAYVSIVRECVDTFNHNIGSLNNAVILPRHWSTDSFPQSGDRPQELLNKQFVRDCDAAVAIFWTQFGSSTGKYESGTEEEIEELLSAGKQVFLYFIDAAIDPSKIDIQQYQKIKNFKEKYKGRGIYSTVKDENEFRKQLTNHVTMYFLSLATGESHPVEKKYASVLGIGDATCIDGGVIHVHNTNFMRCKLVEEKKESALEKLNKLQDAYLPPRIEVEQEAVQAALSSHIQPEVLKLIEATKQFSDKTCDANVPDHWKDVINAFADENKIDLSPDFWNLGELKKKEPIVALTFGGNREVLEGSDEEKQRYSAIEELYWEVIEYNEYSAFFSEIDRNKFASLVVCNTGTTFDEDVDIKLYVKKGCLINPCDIPVPGINTIERILDIRFPEYAYKIEPTDTVDDYSGYVHVPESLDYQIPLPFGGESIRKKYNRNKDKYSSIIEEIFCYKYFETDKFNVVVCHFNYIKHNTKMAFPATLVFKEAPESIDFEITSKYMPEVVKGRLSICNGDNAT